MVKKQRDRFIHVKMDNKIVESYEQVLDKLVEIDIKLENQLTVNDFTIKKRVITKECLAGQNQVVFDMDLTHYTVEVRQNSTWIHDSDYIIKNNTITFKQSFKTNKTLDFILYYISEKI